MKRNVILLMIAIIIAVIGVRPIYAQDFGLAAIDRTSAAKAAGTFANRGTTGASGFTGFLNTALNDSTDLNGDGTSDGVQPNNSRQLGDTLQTFNAVDSATIDFNGDGALDLIVASADDFNNDGIIDQGRITILAGRGDGSFGFPVVVGTAFGAPVSIAAGDVDLDGVLDVALVETGGVEILTGLQINATNGSLFNPATGTLAAISTNRVAFPVGTPAPVSIALGRINSDVFLDFAVAFAGAPGSFAVGLTNPGAATPMFTLGARINTMGSIGPILPNGQLAPSPRAIQIGQLNINSSEGTGNVDADQDIVVATIGGANTGLEFYENNQAIPATPTFAFNGATLAGSQPVGVILTDVNADTRNDLIALNRGSGTVSTFLANQVGQNGAPPGYATPLESLAGANPVDFELINFDGDARIDLAVVNSSVGTGNPNGGSISILNGTGNGQFVRGMVFTTTSRLAGSGGLIPVQNPTSIVTGRFDSRSMTDDIVFTAGTSAANVGGVAYLSAGEIGLNGAVQTSYNLVFLPTYTATSLTADFDGSGGINDVAIIEQQLGAVFVLLNPNRTNFAVSTIVVADLFTAFQVTPTSATSFRGANGMNNLAITDVGTPTSNSGFGQIVVGLNDGTGLFLDIFQFRQFVATPGITNITGGDFDNNGIEDLAFIDYGSNFAGIALNDGTDFFLTPSFRETGGFQPVSAALGDVNDDDNLDLMVLNQGIGIQFNQSIVSVLLGQGNGQLVPTGSLLNVNNFGLSIVGGLQEVTANGRGRITNLNGGQQVDFNLDGFTDFAIVSTRGGTGPANSGTPTVTLLLNRPEQPGSFNVQQPIELVDDTPATTLNLTFPLFVSGRGGRIGTLNSPVALASGGARGGANYLMSVGDFQADGSPDLVVTGSAAVGGINFRSSVYLIGNNSAGNMRVARPIRTGNYGGTNIKLAGGDTFVSCSTGEFSALANIVPDVLHLSLNGNLWVDQNQTSVLNHAPILTIDRRTALNAPFPGGGRKQIITAGQAVSIPVTGTDVDGGDVLAFSLVPPPTGEQPPSFIQLRDNGNNTATILIPAGADINRGPGQARFRIAIQATDTRNSGPGGRLPLTGRTYFTLVVNPNAPPTIGAIANQIIEAGRTATINLNVSDAQGQTVTSSVRCDRGSFVTANGTTLSLAPQAGDVGTSTCTVTATDNFGLASTTTFVVTVNAANVAPTIANIADQTVRAGDVRTVTVSASDANGANGLRLSITSAPSFVSISDNGNGTGTIRISPAVTDTTGGRVTVQVTDPQGLSAMASFNVTVQRAVTISAASRAKPNLFISGIGFGSSGATVSINGTNVSARVVGQSDSSITLKGSLRKLNLRTGPNQITVTSAGTTSNTFVLNLATNED